MATSDATNIRNLNAVSKIERNVWKKYRCGGDPEIRLVQSIASLYLTFLRTLYTRSLPSSSPSDYMIIAAGRWDRKEHNLISLSCRGREQTQTALGPTGKGAKLWRNP